MSKPRSVKRVRTGSAAPAACALYLITDFVNDAEAYEAVCRAGGVVACVWQRELCEKTGREHVQAAIRFAERVPLSTVTVCAVVLRRRDALHGVYVQSVL